MGVVNFILIAVGIASMGFGYAKARGPWRRYQALKAQEENIARYESWRGGVRDDGPTGASVAMEMARRDAVSGAILMAVGFVITILGFLVS